MKKRDISFLLLGLGAGVGIGMWCASKSAEEARNLIAGKAREGADYLKQRGSELKDSASEVIERGESLIGLRQEKAG